MFHTAPKGLYVRVADVMSSARSALRSTNLLWTGRMAFGARSPWGAESSIFFNLSKSEKIYMGRWLKFVRDILSSEHKMIDFENRPWSVANVIFSLPNVPACCTETFRDRCERLALSLSIFDCSMPRWEIWQDGGTTGYSRFGQISFLSGLLRFRANRGTSWNRGNSVYFIYFILFSEK